MLLLLGRPSIFSFRFLDVNQNRQHRRERIIMPKHKLILYKPSGTVKEYADVSVLSTDNIIRLINLPESRGGASISVGMVKFKNNQNGEEISTTLPYTLVFASETAIPRSLNRNSSRIRGLCRQLIGNIPPV